MSTNTLQFSYAMDYSNAEWHYFFPPFFMASHQVSRTLTCVQYKVCSSWRCGYNNLLSESVVASWHNKVPRARNWYTPSENMTTVQMKQVVAADLFMEPISTVNNLPNTCNKPEARRLGAKRVSDKEHDKILEEIAHCAALEHDEILENECDSNSNSHSSSSDDSENDSHSDSDKSGTDNK
jgi:hypothetical protein